MSVLSVRLDPANMEFVQNQLASGRQKTKGGTINFALEMYRKAMLKMEWRQLAEDNKQEDLMLSNQGFEDYLKLIEDDERQAV